jgi:hypothetical protein
MKQKIRNLRAIHGTAVVAMSSRITSSAGWLLGMAMVVRYLTPEETGFYYAFQSLVALQVFLEMGMATVIIMSANHEVANLVWDKTRWVGEARHIERLGSIVRLVGKWYGMAGSAVVCFILPIGCVFFSRQNHGAHPVVWFGPWVALGLAAGFSIAFVGLEAITEGLGAVDELAKSRLAQAFFALLAFVIALRLGAGLWASPIMVAVRVLVGTSVIMKKCGGRLLAVVREPKGETLNWWKDLFPFQWRIALSWMAGYAIFQILTPVIFAYSGAVEAGRFGLAVQATTGIGTVAGAWLQVRQAFWAQGAARRDWAFLDRDFLRVALMTTGLAVLGCVIFGGVLVLGRRWGGTTRLPSWGVYLPLAAAICVNQYVFAMATYLRSFLVEPFLKLSLLMAATVSVGTLLLRHQSPAVLACWYCLVTGTLGLGMGMETFRRWRKTLQANAS